MYNMDYFIPFYFPPDGKCSQKSKQQEFIYSAEAVGYAAEIFMTNCMADVRKLSNKLNLNKNKGIQGRKYNVDDIKEYTLLAYEDEYDALEYVVGAFRSLKAAL